MNFDFTQRFANNRGSVWIALLFTLNATFTGFYGFIGGQVQEMLTLVRRKNYWLGCACHIVPKTTLGEI